MESNLLVISERIKELRKAHNWNQAELAEKMSIDSKMISYYENGKYVPSAEVIVKLAEVFDVSIDYLLIPDIPKKPLRQNINNELIQELSDFENLPDKDKEMIMHMVHTVISKNKMRELAIKAPPEVKHSQKKTH
jgi:transcriptional regulator with XRE-family HTH domain